jgi:hypothetical protein
VPQVQEKASASELPEASDDSLRSDHRIPSA